MSERERRKKKLECLVTDRLVVTRVNEAKRAKEMRMVEMAKEACGWS